MRIILILLAALLFAGCITDSGSDSTDLIGYWKLTNNSYSITFRADGTYASNSWGNGVYKAEGDKLTLVIPERNNYREQTYSHRYRQNGDFLTIITADEQGNKTYYDFLRER